MLQHWSLEMADASKGNSAKPQQQAATSANSAQKHAATSLESVASPRDSHSESAMDSSSDEDSEYVSFLENDSSNNSSAVSSPRVKVCTILASSKKLSYSLSNTNSTLVNQVRVCFTHNIALFSPRHTPHCSFTTPL